jgi:hypothetical protein
MAKISKVQEQQIIADLTGKDDPEDVQLGLPGFDSSIVPFDTDDSAVKIMEATQSAAPLAIFNSSVDALDASDVAPPLLRLTQGQTSEVLNGEAKPGQWIMNNTPAYDTVTCVPLAMAKRRERWVEDGGLVCSSDRSIIGIGNPGGTCADCFAAKWEKTEKGNYPPECIFMYSYIMYVKEFDTIALFNFKKTSIGIGKMLNSLMMQRGFGKLAVKFSSRQQKSKAGVYFTPAISPVDDPEAIEMSAGAF